MTNFSNKFSKKEKTFVEKEQERVINRPKSLSLCDDEESSSFKIILKKEVTLKARDCSCSDSDDNPYK